MVPVLLLASQWGGPPSIDKVEFIVWEREAYVVGLPRAISVDGLVSEIEFSPTGNRALLTGTAFLDLAALVRGQRLRAERRYWVWDGGLTARPLLGISGTLSWDQSGSRLMETKKKGDKVTFQVLDAQSLAPRPWSSEFPFGSALSFDGAGNSVLFTVTDGQGALKIGDRPAVPVGKAQPSAFGSGIVWETASTGFLVVYGDSLRSFRFDTRSGAVAEVDEHPEPSQPLPGGLFVWPETENNELRLALAPFHPGAGKLAPGSRTARIGFGTAQVTVAPAQDRVVMIQEGLPVVRSLTKVDFEVYQKATIEAQKAEAISVAKQMALAMLMYAGDNDDVLPPLGEKFREAVLPYIKDAALLNRFVPSLGGVGYSTIDNPADTPIGHVDGPGGRAVAYADGSVRWVADK